MSPFEIYICAVLCLSTRCIRTERLHLEVSEWWKWKLDFVAQFVRSSDSEAFVLETQFSARFRNDKRDSIRNAHSVVALESTFTTTGVMNCKWLNETTIHIESTRPGRMMSTRYVFDDVSFLHATCTKKPVCRLEPTSFRTIFLYFNLDKSEKRHKREKNCILFYERRMHSFS